MAFLWYTPAAVALAVQAAGGGGPSDLTATDSFTVTETAVVEVFPVATESLTVTDGNGVVLAIATGVESYGVTEDAVATLGASNLNANDSVTVTDSLTEHLATHVLVDSLTVTEVASHDATMDRTESLTVSEVALGFAEMVVVDSFTVTELAQVTEISGGNAESTDNVTVTEVAVVTLTVDAADSLTVPETALGFADPTGTDSFTVTEQASTAADFTGAASGTVSLTPRIQSAFGVAQILITCDSTYVTCDSVDVTCDGSFIGALPIAGAHAPSGTPALIQVSGSPGLEP